MTFSNHEIKPEDSPLTRRQAGLGHIPEDRQTMGAALGATLTENFIMGGLSDPAYTSPGVISYTRAGDVAKRQYENFDVKYASLNEPAGALSGGNLQKAIEERGKDVCMIGNCVDESTEIPGQVPFSNFTDYYKWFYDTMQEVSEGKFETGVINQGLKEGAVKCLFAEDDVMKVPQEIKDLVAEYEQKIIDGTIVPPAELEEEQ